jgi:glycosyltransferase involved in cell wall biosynthesis
LEGLAVCADGSIPRRLLESIACLLQALPILHRPEPVGREAMKIAFFTEIYDCGGVDTFIVNLINNWPDKQDAFVLIANANYPGLRVVEDNLKRPCEIIRQDILVNRTPRGGFLTNVLRLISPVSRYLSILAGIFSLRKILKQNNPDILMVINGGYPGGHSCRAAAIAWGMFSGKPLSIHNFHSIVARPAWYLRLQEYVVDAVLCRVTAKFVAVSRAAAMSMAARPGIHRAGKTVFIHNGIDSLPAPSESGGDIRGELGISSHAPLCLMLATYDQMKGHDFLLKAFQKVVARVPDAHLLICGFGVPPDVHRVRRYVADLKLGDSVHLMGFRKDLAQLLSNADVLLVASQALEAFGFSSIEAMAHHVPVVATTVGGIPEVVENGDGGYCVSPDDVAGYADRIVELLKDDKLRAEQAQKGFARVQRLFSARTMAEKYCRLLKGAAADSEKSA